MNCQGSRGSYRSDRIVRLANVFTLVVERDPLQTETSILQDVNPVCWVGGCVGLGRQKGERVKDTKDSLHLNLAGRKVFPFVSLAINKSGGKVGHGCTEGEGGVVGNGKVVALIYVVMIRNY